MILNRGLQVFSVSKKLSEDFAGTMEELSRIGYRYLEFANMNVNVDCGIGNGMSAGRLKEILDRNRLNIIGCHMGTGQYTCSDDQVKRAVSYHQELGNFCLMISMGFFPNDLSGVLRKCEYYNHIGKLCFDMGSRVLYHNHLGEFVEFDGVSVFDLLAQNTDPDYIGFEPDTFWLARAGVDVVKFFEKYGARIRMLHLKDCAGCAGKNIEIWERFGCEMKDAAKAPRPITAEDYAAFPRQEFTELGTGILPLQEYIDAAIQYTAAEYAVIEQDHTQYADPIDSARISFENLAKYQGIL